MLWQLFAAFCLACTFCLICAAEKSPLIMEEEFECQKESK